MHSHSRGGATQALSSAEGEIMSASELLKEALGVQFILEFIGFGLLPVRYLTDATAAKAFTHRRGAGRVKHIDIGFMWLQDACDKGAYIPKKFPRAENPSDMLTKVPATDVQKFRAMIGLFPLDAALEPERRVYEAIPGQSVQRRIMSVLMLASMVNGSKASEWHEENDGSYNYSSTSFAIMMLTHALAFLAMLMFFHSTRAKHIRVDHIDQSTQTTNINAFNVEVQATAAVAPAPPQPVTVAPREIVVSRSGQRYHVEGCPSIYESTGLRRLQRCQFCHGR